MIKRIQYSEDDESNKDDNRIDVKEEIIVPNGHVKWESALDSKRYIVVDTICICYGTYYMSLDLFFSSNTYAENSTDDQLKCRSSCYNMEIWSDLGSPITSATFAKRIINVHTHLRVVHHATIDSLSGCLRIQLRLALPFTSQKNLRGNTMLL